jgi:SAM-dependent methyltransferase
MLNIPNDAVKYILFQRTEYLVYQNTSWLNKIIIRIPFLTYNKMVCFEAWFFRNRVKKLFTKDMLEEYEGIKNALPDDPKHILDIGCGVAGIDIMLNKHYVAKKQSPHMYLLDKSELNDKVYYGIEKVAAYYNSLDVAKKLLTSNDVDVSRVHIQEVNDSPIFPGTQFDLIISLISWGFHYPVNTYLDQAYNILRPGGRLIIDVRKGTDGEELLKQKFGSVEVLSEAKKHRCVLVKKPVAKV